MSNLTPTTYEIIKELTAKVQELEEDLRVHKALSIALQTPENINKIKVDAIEEMYNELRLDLQSCGCSLRIPEYADKLREGEDDLP